MWDWLSNNYWTLVAYDKLFMLILVVAILVSAWRMKRKSGDTD